MLPLVGSPAFFSASLIGLVWSERFQRLPLLCRKRKSSGDRFAVSVLKKSAALVCNMARFGSLDYYTVKGNCRYLCDGRNIVEKSDQSDAQKVFALFSDH
jgi:hypothetical protein